MFLGGTDFFFLFLFCPLLERYFILCAESSSNHTSLLKTRFLQHRVYLLRLYPQTMRLSLQTKRVCVNHSCLSSNCAFLNKQYVSPQTTRHVSLLKLQVVCLSSNYTCLCSNYTSLLKLHVSFQTTLVLRSRVSLLKLPVSLFKLHRVVHVSVFKLCVSLDHLCVSLCSNYADHTCLCSNDTSLALPTAGMSRGQRDAVSFQRRQRDTVSFQRRQRYAVSLHRRQRDTVSCQRRQRDAVSLQRRQRARTCRQHSIMIKRLSYRVT